LSATDETFGRAEPHPAGSELQANTSGDNPRRRTAVPNTGKKIEPAAGASDRPIADLKGKKGKALPPSRMATGNHSSKPVFRSLFFRADLHGFHAVSASVLVLNVPLSTTVVVVVVGFLPTTVHFLVEASRTT